MKHVLLTAIVAMVFLLSADAQTKTIHLPTTAYRTEGSNEIKVNYTYDSNGRVIAEHRYLKKADGNYILVDSIACAYHQLPSGKFITVKDEAKRQNVNPELLGRDEDTWDPIFGDHLYELYSHNKTTSAYDNKGMQLWEQSEYLSRNSDQWGISREEAVLNGDGIRQYYNGNISTSDEGSYTFDEKGRVAGYSYEDDSYYSGYSRTSTYTRGEDDMLISFSESNEYRERDGDEVNISSDEFSYNNIVTVLNGEYFEPYSLSPVVFGMEQDVFSDDRPWGEPAPLSFTDIQKYAWDDYTLRQWFFNMDASGTADGEQMSGTWRTVVDNAKGEIAIIISMEGMEAKQVYKKLPYGGYKYSTIEDGDTTSIKIMKYNQYGALIRDYYYDSYHDSYYDHVSARTYMTDNTPANTMRKGAP